MIGDDWRVHLQTWVFPVYSGPRKEGRKSVEPPGSAANIWVPDASTFTVPAFWQEKVTISFLFIELTHLLATLTFFLMKLCVSLPPEANMKK